MDIQEILGKCDHTLLTQTATWADIKGICDDGMKYHTASVCIPPCFVRRAKEYVGDRLQICTVIGFPNGYSTTPVKLVETVDALKNGADEIDMVINIGELKAGNTDYVRDEIRTLKAACGEKILKVIIETCLLTDEEKVTIALFAANVGPGVRMKAAGGISSIADAEKFIELGASRLGTSRIVKIVKADEKAAQGGY